MIERHVKYTVRDLGPESIVFPEAGQCLHCGLALVCKGAAGADGIRKGIVALTDQVWEL